MTFETFTSIPALRLAVWPAARTRFSTVLGEAYDPVSTVNTPWRGSRNGASSGIAAAGDQLSPTLSPPWLSTRFRRHVTGRPIARMSELAPLSTQRRAHRRP